MDSCLLRIAKSRMARSLMTWTTFGRTRRYRQYLRRPVSSNENHVGTEAESVRGWCWPEKGVSWRMSWMPKLATWTFHRNRLSAFQLRLSLSWSMMTQTEL